MPRLRVTLLALVVLAIVVPTTQAAMYTAPGRTAFDVGGPAPVNDVRTRGATAAAALGDGGAVLAANESGSLFADEPGNGLILARVRSDGSLVPTFGTRGIARVPGSLALTQLLTRPDGRMLVVGTLVRGKGSDLGHLYTSLVVVG